MSFSLENISLDIILILSIMFGTQPFLFVSN